MRTERLRRVALTGCGLLLAGVIAGPSLCFFNTQRASLDRLAQARTSFQQQRHAMEAARKLLVRWQPAVRALARRGILGPEQRLAWIGLMQRAARQPGLASLDWTIAPQAPFTAGLALPLAGLELRASRISVRAGLRDLPQLVTLLEVLTTGAPGLVRVHDCHVENTVGPSGEPGAAKLDARCALDWVSIPWPAPGTPAT